MVDGCLRSNASLSCVMGRTREPERRANPLRARAFAVGDRLRSRQRRAYGSEENKLR
jgi:hypothetical protein